MNTLLLGILGLTVAVNCGLSIFLVVRTRRSRSFAEDIRDDLRLGREEARTSAKESRDDALQTMRSISEALRDQSALQQNHFSAIVAQLKEFSEANRLAADGLRATLDSRITALQDGNDVKLESVRTVLELIRDTVDQKLGRLREEVAAGLQANSDASSASLDRMMSAHAAERDQLSRQLKDLSETNQGSLDRIRATLDTRLLELQSANDRSFDEVTREVSGGLKLCSDSLYKNLTAASNAQQSQLEAMTRQVKELSQESQVALDRIGQGLDVSVREMRAGNEQKLEEMRRTVDEKLHDTLEKRLGESFKLVSDRLDTVHRGLGEMQGLASGVGDLRRMLTNVKIRGTWGEVQLASILTDMLATDQWSRNVCMREGSTERVECAVRLPGPKGDQGTCVWLPIDSKFPQEDYARLQTAADSADSAQVQQAQEALLRTIRTSAREIHDKYINPPATTDFAIMFLATEGLYAEVLREPGFVQELQNRYRVSVAGPTTLAALLTSLRLGFQTLAIEQRADEVWRVLGAVKTEFAKFGGVLDKVHRQLQTASRTIEETGTRTRVMERKLRSVEKLDPAETATVLALPTGDRPDVEQGQDFTDFGPADVGDLSGAQSSELSSTGTDSN
jgi:DNA recombination protein RmuC